MPSRRPEHRTQCRPGLAAALSGLAFSVLLVLGSAWTVVAQAEDRPRAFTALGEIVGVQDDGLSVYRGIPYAAPPVGEGRWRPPAPVMPWSGPRDATEFGGWCPQILRPNYSAGLLDPARMSEDCLVLNVWTPATSPDAGLPVMVWINPGSFRRGSAQLPRYEGSALARQGVVLVTFDYRIGLLGQFAHPALSEAQAGEPLGNYGLMDQLAALRWVRDHIGAFGGDPGRVTIFGMSAGGVSVNYLMAMPSAAGLFQGAISQSSGIRVSAPRRLDRSVGGVPSLDATGEAVAAHFGLDGEPVDIARDLRALSVEDLLAYQENPALMSPGSLNPVLDGVLVNESVGEVFRAGRQHPVPYLAGTASWEGSLVSFMSGPEPLYPVFGLDAERADRLYPGMDARARVNAIETDFFHASQRYLARHHAAAGHPAWLYFFDRVLESHLGEFPGAAHGAETRYVFQTLDTLADTPQSGYGRLVTEEDRDYARRVSRDWVGFARKGVAPGLWAPVTDSGEMIRIYGQTNLILERTFRSERLEHFEALFDDGSL